MNKSTLDRELWQAIEGFEIDGRESGKGPEVTFEARLAREQDWSREFTSKVVGEYRRFIYLAATAGHPVSPSKTVDEAWHLHLTFTRSYWDRLCGQVLQRPLHHEPSRGGSKEETKFEDWYLKTLRSYREAFGEEAPGEVWPQGGPKATAEAKPVHRRPRSGAIKGALAVCGAGLAMAGCMAATGSQSGSWTMFAAGTVIFAVICLVVAAAKARQGTSHRTDGSGCGYMGTYGGGESSGCNDHGGHHGGHHGDGGLGDSGGGHGDSGGGSSCGSSDGGGGSSCGSSGCGSSGCGGGGCGGS